MKKQPQMKPSPSERFPFIVKDKTLGNASLMPYLPITLTRENQSIQVNGLLDTGAAVSVLPYSMGLQLWADWDTLNVPLQLAGNLAQYPTKALSVFGQVGELEPVRLIFGWIKSDIPPLLLGQVNFFMEFDLFFSRSQQFFDISRKVI